jgi:hypothetical protein
MASTYLQFDAGVVHDAMRSALYISRVIVKGMPCSVYVLNQQRKISSLFIGAVSRTGEE